MIDKRKGCLVNEMNAAFTEETAEAFAAERAQALHEDIVRLVAVSISEAGMKMLRQSRARQSKQMRPYIVSGGSFVRVSCLHSPTARKQLKSALVRQISPTYTLEIYRVVGRKLAEISRRVVIYDLQCNDDSISEGEQAPTIVGRYKIRLPLQLKDVDRRYLMPIITNHCANASSFLTDDDTAVSTFWTGL